MSAIATLIEQQREVRQGVFGERVQELDNVVSRYLPMFYKRAFRFLGNTPDAEDAVQDALLSAYKHLGQFKGQAQMSTWVSAIVSNSARMHLRKRPRHTQLSLDERFGDQEEYSLAERLASHGPSPEDESRFSELHRNILRFMTQLSPPLRNAFQLRDLDGLSTSEAAQVLG